MRRHATVAVHHDLASGQPGIGLRTADLEPAGRIDQDADALGIELELAEHRVDDLGLHIGREERVDIDLLTMLRRDQHGVHADGRAVLVLDRDLALAVRRRYGTTPALRTSARRLVRRWAMAM